MIEQLKELFKQLPITAWLIIALVVGFSIYMSYDTIGGWVESAKQYMFDKKDKKKEDAIEAERLAKEEALRKAASHEANEIILGTQVSALREEIAKTSSTKKADEKIDEAGKVFKDDLAVIEEFKKGKISAFDLCRWRCQRFKDSDYPCEPNYCERYKAND